RPVGRDVTALSSLVGRPPGPLSPLFPYTTLFRSEVEHDRDDHLVRPAPRLEQPRHRARRRPRQEARAQTQRQRHPRRRGWRCRRSEEHTSELQSLAYLVCRLLLEKKNPEHITPEA